MTPAETPAERTLRLRRNALDEVGAAAASARALGATDGDIVRASIGQWFDGDDVVQLAGERPLSPGEAACFRTSSRDP